MPAYKSSPHFNIKGFVYAFNGLQEAFSTQANFKIHTIVSMLVIAAGFYFHLNATEWCLILIVIGMVITAECVNTALEYFTDLVSPHHNPAAGKIKDISAAAVLTCSVIAAATGLIIFIPKVFF